MGTGPHSRDTRRQWIENIADVDVDLEPFWRGGGGWRRWFFFRRRLQHAQLEVLPELSKCNVYGILMIFLKRSQAYPIACGA